MFNALITNPSVMPVIQVDLAHRQQDLDITFFLPGEGVKADYHYRSAFYLAVISMVTGWKMDAEVGCLLLL